jgi:hypothetical protein
MSDRSSAAFSRLVRSLIPQTLRSGGVARGVASIMSHILFDYGWLRSARAGRSIDATGEPIPWFSYPAIDFVKQLDLKELTVFEYGSGFSTLFWAKRAKKVISVETQKEWFEEIAGQLPSNAELLLVSPEVNSYASLITRYDRFNIIVIDGTGESRLRCSQLAARSLDPNGFVILDNSDLWPLSAAALRDADLIQADFTGLVPGSSHWNTTSIFFSRQYNFRSLDGRQPHRSVAQPAMPWADA